MHPRPRRRRRAAVPRPGTTARSACRRGCRSSLPYGNRRGLAIDGRALRARRRVALIQLEGDPGGEVQDAVSAAFDPELAVVGPKEVNRAIDKLGFDADMTEKDLKKLANELDADAIVQGKISSGDNDHRILH